MSERPEAPTKRVLFVCTGNIFRSMTAEYALRAALGESVGCVVESAGTEDYPHVVAPVVANHLLARGFDVGSHKRRTLTHQMLDAPGIVIAMSSEHVVTLRDVFHYTSAPLFTSACGLPAQPLPDVEEAVADYATNPAAVAAHVRATIDRIIELTPQLARRLAGPDGMLSWAEPRHRGP